MGSVATSCGGQSYTPPRMSWRDASPLLSSSSHPEGVVSLDVGEKTKMLPQHTCTLDGDARQPSLSTLTATRVGADLRKLLATDKASAAE